MKSIVRISRLLILIGLVLTACHREPATQSRTAPGSDRAAPAARSADEAPAQSAQLTCAPPRRVCTGCTGAPICAIRCPECPPPAASATGDAPATLALGPVGETCGDDLQARRAVL